MYNLLVSVVDSGTIADSNTLSVEGLVTVTLEDLNDVTTCNYSFNE